MVVGRTDATRKELISRPVPHFAQKMAIVKKPVHSDKIPACRVDLSPLGSMPQIQNVPVSARTERMM